MNIFRKACWNCHFSCWNSIRRQRAKNGRNVKHNTKTLSLIVSCIQVLVCLSQPESSSSIANSWANYEWKVPALLGVFNSAEPHKAGIAYDAYGTYIYIYSSFMQFPSAGAPRRSKQMPRVKWSALSALSLQFTTTMPNSLRSRTILHESDQFMTGYHGWANTPQPPLNNAHQHNYCNPKNIIYIHWHIIYLSNLEKCLEKKGWQTKQTGAKIGQSSREFRLLFGKVVWRSHSPHVNIATQHVVVLEESHQSSYQAKAIHPTTGTSFVN